MKRSTLFVFVLISLAMAGCNERGIIQCGNGVLDEGEVCDGTLFKEGIQLQCENGLGGDASAVKCTEICTLDMSEACVAKCGNGVLEPGEECDGSQMPVVMANCDAPDIYKVACESCRVVDKGMCGEPGDPGTNVLIETCNNGALDDGELCDGEFIRDSAKVCPEHMVLKDASKFKCLSSCRLVDVSEACVPEIVTCGNGVLEEDKGEWCDGDIFSENVAFEPCLPGMDQDFSRLVCTNDCQIDSSNLCVPKLYIVISEVVPALEDAGEYMTIGGLALEFTNMGKTDLDISACSLDIYKADGTLVKKYEMADLGVDSIGTRESLVICSQTTDHFNGVCDAEITEDLIQKNISDAGYMTMVCGDINVDVFNLNSFIVAVNNGAVDFSRMCDQLPVTQPGFALLGEGWAITALNDGAPVFGLGEHCAAEGLSIESCSYTISTNTLTSRAQNIEQQLDIKIPGLTTRSDKTDVSSSIEIRFISGKLKGNNVSSQNIHYVSAKPDTTWSSSDGVDRYIGVLHNVDTYEGYIAGDEGSYVLDAAVSFDNELTWVYCGPKGVVENYETYEADKRNRLDVVYEMSTCGDKVITGSEVCDGEVFLEEALICDKAGEVVTDRSQLKCHGCNMVSTANACSEPISTCGNETLDNKEICDGDLIPESAKACPDGMVTKDDAEYICNSTCTGIDIPKACEAMCGNGKLDGDEICDGTLLNEEMARLAARCEKKDSEFDLSRAACHACQLDMAVCVPNTKIVVDEYLVKMDESGKPVGIAVTVNNYGSESIDLSGCSFTLLDNNGTLIRYYPLTEVAGAEDAVLEPCKPLVICSEPTGSESEYKQYFGECDATLADNILVSSRSTIDKIQLSCLGNFVDYFDYSGMVSNLSTESIHGKLKSSDTRPWPSRTTVVLKDRMDLDNQFDLNRFAKPVCE